MKWWRNVIPDASRTSVKTGTRPSTRAAAGTAAAAGGVPDPGAPDAKSGRASAAAATAGVSAKGSGADVEGIIVSPDPREGSDERRWKPGPIMHGTSVGR